MLVTVAKTLKNFTKGKFYNGISHYNLLFDFSLQWHGPVAMAMAMAMAWGVGALAKWAALFWLVGA